MQRNLIIGLNILSLGIILTACNFWNTAILFLLVGAIPGASFTLAPSFMMALVITTAVILCVFFTYRIEPEKNGKGTLPKKRYGRI